MTKITQAIESWVIDEYSSGGTLDEVADITNLAKGSVYNIIKKWKSQLKDGNIDEIRKFRNSLKKSGLTIEDCALGFRMIKILDKFHLYDDFEKPLIDLTFSRENTKNSNQNDFLSHFVTEEIEDKDDLRIKGNEILSFLVDIYEPCRRNKFKPVEIIKWIEDLLNNFSHNDKSEIIVDKITGEDISSNKDVTIEIPTITQANTFLESKNQQYVELRNKISEGNIDLSKVSKKLTQKYEDLKNIEEREKVTLQYLNWYKNLKFSLRNNVGIGMEQVIDDFIRMMIEFKDYNFDPIQLINDYRKMKSLNGEIIDIQSEINTNLPKRDSLRAEIQEESLKLMQINQTLTVYRTLESIGFGLKELKYLYNTVREIAVANNIVEEVAVNKFLADVDRQYDNKLGFENIAKELELMTKQLKKEIPEIKNRAYVEGSIDYLRRNGITDKDIIEMSTLVRIFIDKGLLLHYSITQEVRDRPWSFFIQDLVAIKNLQLEIKNLQLEIKNLTTYRDNLNLEVNRSQMNIEPPDDI